MLGACIAAVIVLGGPAAALSVVAAPAAAAAAGAHAAHRDARRGSGPVDVLYAGSLLTLMQTSVGPAFHAATGYSVTGIAEGSTALAAEIKGGVRRADVFISASPSTNAKLEGASNGNWVSWYATFATSPLVLGYDRSSRFAAALRHKPWWRVVTQPGFLLGRTNPATDPKGVLAVKALDTTAKQHHDPALAALAAKVTNVFPEQTLVGRLQAGQLDAGFFYAVEAAAAKLPTVKLAGVPEHASYTLTVLARAPHAAAADAFVKYLLGPKAKTLLAKQGLIELGHAKLSGRRAAVPAPLRRAVE